MDKKKSLHDFPSHPSSPSTLQEISEGIQAIKKRVVEVEDLGKEGLSYSDALRERTELQIRETVRKIFGDRSQEYLRFMAFHIKSSNHGDLDLAIRGLQDLLRKLENRKIEIMDLHSPPRSHATSRTLGAGHDSIFPPSPLSTRPPSPPRPSFSASAGTGSPPRHSASGPISPPSQTTRPSPLGKTASPIRSASSQTTSPPRIASPGLPGATSPAPKPPLTANHQGSSQNQPKTPTANHLNVETPPVQGTLGRIARIGDRFHKVAKQLRLRGEYRATLEIEDCHDVQDLFYSLLGLDFDDIGKEDWVPSYANNSHQTAFLVDQGRTAVVVKKTRPGLGPKEIAQELMVDVQRFSTLHTCRALFCFVYDPEGRIGNPRGLETDLTSLDQGFQLYVLVDPK